MGLAAKALTRSRLVSEFGLPDDAAGSGQWTLRRFWLGDRVRRSLYFRPQDRVADDLLAVGDEVNPFLVDQVANTLLHRAFGSGH